MDSYLDYVGLVMVEGECIEYIRVVDYNMWEGKLLENSDSKC